MHNWPISSRNRASIPISLERPKDRIAAHSPQEPSSIPPIHQKHKYNNKRVSLTAQVIENLAPWNLIITDTYRNRQEKCATWLPGNILYQQSLRHDPSSGASRQAHTDSYSGRSSHHSGNLYLGKMVPKRTLNRWVVPFSVRISLGFIKAKVSIHIRESPRKPWKKDLEYGI